ncbi:hypothetical protein DEU56DRAFT_813176 [Suillus clintonianus]|uniref:uncharacterized protein n=1 Tax=Suillus clintonianus TaxID=1904413 RepID=UPI001B861330|nr:uncharacterized protein DEU56DRAFT_813176 [Suillus clintonianus]KAG2131765.1 hypothetical protein DEU56DRAFT_813176 [Suillus clintonianus]
MALHYFPEAFTFNGTPGESSLRDREQALPESLCYTSSITKVLCFVAIGCSDLEDHWESLQSDEAFEKVRGSQCSILSSTISAASLLLATSGIFVTTGSPVSYLAYNSPATYFLLFMSLMMAMIAMLTSGLNMIRWLQADRQWTREQLMPGGYFLLSYLLSIVMPILFVGLSLNCFIFAMLVAGFYSQNTVCCILTAVWLVIYVVSIGTILMEFAWKYAKCLKSR